MSTLFSGINTALQAMLASQQAIQTVEHNVANANTPGYRRQEVVMQTARPYSPVGLYSSATSGGQIGMGVQVQSVRRFKLEIFDGSYRQELGQTAYWTTNGELLGQVERRLTENSDGSLLNGMDEFWDGWRTLESDPTNPTMRQDLLQRAASLTYAFKTRVQTLTDMRSQLDGSVTNLVGDINQSAARVAQLNADIGAVLATGQQPNDLMDERDRLIDHLAQISGAVAHEQGTGQTLVSIGGHALVVGDSSYALQTAPSATDPGISVVQWAHDPTMKVTLPKSELAALLEVRDVQIDGQIEGLNDLAEYLISSVNTYHTTGYDANGVLGQPFFTGDDASNITVNISDGSQIAAAMSADAPGDGSNAGRMANFQFEAYLLPGNTKTLNELYQDQVSGLGLTIQAAENKSGSHQLLVDALEQQRQSVEGVSLDEEAANLVRYQRTYQAAARLVTAMDEMLDRVINGMGRVGL